MTGRWAPAKAWVGWAFRLALTALLLWVTLRKVPVPAILAALRRADPVLAGGSVLVFMAGSVLVETARLTLAGRLLQERQPGPLGWNRIFLESRPFFYLLPGALASEGVVWMRLRAYDWRHASCGFVVLSTRIWGVATWGLAAAFALSYPGGPRVILAQAPAWSRSPGFWAAGGLAAGIAAFLAPAFVRRFKGLPIRPPVHRTSLAMGAAALGSALLVTLSVLLASRAAGTPLPFHSAMGLMALFNFAMILPVSLGGFGLQEAMILLLGAPLGYPAPALIAFSALIHLQRLLLSLAGLGVFLGGRGAALRTEPA